MKVLSIMTTRVGNTGISSVVTDLAKYNNNDQIQIDYVFPNLPPEKLLKILEKKESKYFILNTRRFKSLILYFKELLKLMKNSNYDLVHIHANSHTATVELLAAKMAGIKHRVVHSHSTSTAFPLLNKFFKLPFNLLLTYGFASSIEAGEWLFNDDNYSVIPTGIDTEAYKYSLEKRRKIRSELEIKDDEILFGHVGMFTTNKNQILLIEILNYLKKIDSNYKLILVGLGPEIKKCMAVTKSLSLENEIIFYGEADNVNEIYSAMDYFVFPSYTEGFGLALLEAQASGLKCFASDSIPAATNVTGDVIFFELSSDIKEIAYLLDSAVKEETTERENKKNFEIIMDSEFDSSNSVKMTENLYKDIFERVEVDGEGFN